MRQLTIEPEFRDKIPPLSAEEFSRLEENIRADGEVLEPLVVWHNTIVDGHHRWAIIQKHPEIPYKVKQMEFPDKWAAIAWMCRNQLGRRNLTDEQKTYLTGKQYEAEKMTAGGDRRSGEFSKGQSGLLKFDNTAQKVAHDLGIGETTVKRSENFARGLDAAEVASPGIREAILSGEVKAPKSVIAMIRNIPDEQKTYLIGKQYEAQKMSSGGDRRSEEFSSLQNEDLKIRTKDIVAHDLIEPSITDISGQPSQGSVSSYKWAFSHF